MIGVNPVFNKDLVKVGAIRHANIPKESKHQNILSKNQPLTQKLALSLENNSLMAGSEEFYAIV